MADARRTGPGFSRQPPSTKIFMIIGIGRQASHQWEKRRIRTEPVAMDWQDVKYYVGLAVLVVLLVVSLVTAYRVWVEIHDVEEPDSPADLLQSFELAHAAGDLDDEEFR